VVNSAVTPGEGACGEHREPGAPSGTRVDAVTVGSATVTCDDSQTTPAAIAQAVTDAGDQPVDSASLAGAAVCAGKAGTGGGCCCGELPRTTRTVRQDPRANGQPGESVKESLTSI
jgi:hypothetical protein